MRRSFGGEWIWWVVKLAPFPSFYLGLPLGSNLKPFSLGITLWTKLGKDWSL